MNIAVLLLKCRNEPRVTTLTRDQVHQMTGHVAGYLAAQSGQRENLEFRVFDWFEMPLTSAEWNALAFGAGAKVVPMVEQAQRVDLSSYGHFVLLIDKQDAYLAAWNTPGALKYNYMAAQSLNPALMEHELGHMYGADHANLDTPNGLKPIEEYGDRFCVMGAEGAKYSFADARFGPDGPGMCASTLYACNWLRFDQPAVSIDLKQSTDARANEVAFELAALRGAPPPGWAGLPVVAWARRASGRPAPADRVPRSR